MLRTWFQTFSSCTRSNPSVLTLNCGSSSIKYQLIEAKTETVVLKGLINMTDLQNQESGGKSYQEAMVEALSRVTQTPDLNLCGVGHRIVHGGSKFTSPVVIDASCERELDNIGHLAPLHNPHNLMGVRLAREYLGDTEAQCVPHVGIFDTAFHGTIAPHIRTYAISKQLRDEGVRQYGFHGISVQHVVNVSRSLLGTRESRRLVVLHLGAGCSATAVRDGLSVDTSMGMTPLDGLVSTYMHIFICHI